jgi:hypothetical protein
MIQELRFASLLVLAAACGPSSPGTACKDQLLPGDLVLTEVFADFQAPAGGAGTDTGKEWFEVYNASDRPLDLKGLTIVHSRPDGSKAQQHTMLEVTVAPGTFYTFGNATQDLVPPYVDYGYSADLGDFYNADGGKLALKCGDSEIDSATYEGVKSGHSRELSAQSPPEYTFNDDPLNWCEGKDSEFEPANFGTPGQDNDCVPVIAGQCTDNGTPRDVVPAGAGDLVITEVMPGPAKVSDTLGEWFEAKALKDVDLNGLGLDRASDTTKAEIITSAACVHVTAGSYVLFAKNADTAMNGGLPAGAVRGTFKFALVAGTAAAPGDVQIVSGATVVDAITWSKSASGKALQLDPDFTDPTANDSETNFCNAITPYGLGDLGTPNVMNDQCTTLQPAGMCDDNGTLRAIVKPPAGALVISEIMPNPKVEPAQEWFEITNVGTTAFDVNDLGLDRAGDTRVPDVIHSVACKSIAPNGFALFAKSADPTTNGMLPAVDGTFGFSMVNSGAGDVQVVDGATVLDAVTWTTSTDGVSKQVKPANLTTTGNDAAANFCPGVAPYGDQTNKGTPKATNAC